MHVVEGFWAYRVYRVQGLGPLGFIGFRLQGL